MCQRFLYYYLLLEFGFMSHHLGGDFTVRNDNDGQWDDPAPNPQNEDEHFGFHRIGHVVESAAGQIALCAL